MSPKLIEDVQDLEKEIQLPPPFLYQGQYVIECILAHDPQKYDAYWYHPDHLGSSNYITNFNGNISQHLEYLPFGETLVEEHLNSYNSPYKFNAKELDTETGNYYYGARYYNPKWGIWLSVDPLAGKYPGWSPYNYTFQNPINFVDPDGRAPCPPGVDCLGLIKALVKGKSLINRVGETLRNIEPDAININNIGIDIGVGVKDFKIGKLGHIDLDGSFGSITYDKNNDEINIKGPSGSIGLFLGNKDIGLSASGETFDYGVINSTLTVGNLEGEANLFDIGLDESTSINGAHLGKFSLFDSKLRDEWFNGSIGNSALQNRQIDVNNDGKKSSMFIIGGEVKFGIKGDFEWNVDQTMSHFLGGKGVGNEWKNK